MSNKGLVTIDIRICVPADPGIEERTVREGGEKLLQGCAEGRLPFQRNGDALLRQADVHCFSCWCRAGHGNGLGVVVAVGVSGDLEDVIARRNDEDTRCEIEDRGHVFEAALLLV